MTRSIGYDTGIWTINHAIPFLRIASENGALDNSNHEGMIYYRPPDQPGMARRSLLVLLPLMALALSALMAMPTASAAEPWGVYPEDDGPIHLGAGETKTFHWVVFTYDSSPVGYHLTSTAEIDSGGVGVEITGNKSAVVEPGDYVKMEVKVTAERDVMTESKTLFVNLTMTRMDASEFSETRAVTVQVDSKAMFDSTGNNIFGMWENNLPAPFDTLTWSFIFTVLIWAAIAAFIYFVVNPIVTQFTKRTKTEVDDRILRIVRAPIFILIILYGAVDSLDMLQLRTETHVLIWQIYRVFMVLLLSYTAYKVFNQVLLYYAEKWAEKTATQIDDVLVPLFQKLGMIAIPLIALSVLLSVFGVDVTLLVAGLGMVSLVVAFAAQETLGNLFSGIQLQLDRPFAVGDLIEMDGGDVCEVKKIGLRSTHLYNTYDHEMIIVPNNELASNSIKNISRPDNRRCIAAETSVAYGTDLEKVGQALLSVARSHPEVVQEEGFKPFIRMTKFDESGIGFKLWFYVDSSRKQGRVGSEVRTLIDKKFKEEGIEIPFPQTVVTFKNAIPERPERNPRGSD